MKVINLYKPQGFTPLQTINKFREKYSSHHLSPLTKGGLRGVDWSSVKLGVAGRLDPMAEGVMLVLVGEENKNKQKYIKLDKVYKVEILLGVQTDTYDALGIPVIARESPTEAISLKSLILNLKSILPKYLGKITQTYPPYSTKTVKGKPLWQWAREGLSDKIVAPEQEVEIFEIELLEQKNIPAHKLEKDIISRIKKVESDFRQKEIITAWKKLFMLLRLSATALASAKGLHDEAIFFPAAIIRVHCSSGTYMRALAHDLGQDLGRNAIALSITRTKIGKYTIKNSLKL